MLPFHENSKKKIWLDIPDSNLRIPAVLICGAESGPCVTVSAGIHSREYVGVQAIQQFINEIDTASVAGRIIFLPAINYNGFISRSADVVPEDGKNLNRVFPGHPNGTASEQIAYFLTEQILPHTDFLIDLHSGGFCEDLFPHAYLNQAAHGAKLARFTNISYGYNSCDTCGFSGYAGSMGIPGILLERGGRGIWSQNEVELVIQDLKNLLRGIGVFRDMPPILYNPFINDEAFFQDAPSSGLWYPHKKAGETAKKHECLGEICNIFGEVQDTICAEYDCVVLYQTISLGIEKNTPLIAYQKL